MALPFLDTNIFLRHLRADHAEHSPKATAYLGRIERGESKVKIAESIIFESVYSLQRSYKQPKAAIRDALLPLIELPGIVLPGKKLWRDVFDLYVRLNLPFVDAYHAVIMKRQKLTKIVSFDRDYDRIPGITRIEPQ